MTRRHLPGCAIAPVVNESVVVAQFFEPTGEHSDTPVGECPKASLGACASAEPHALLIEIHILNGDRGEFHAPTGCFGQCPGRGDSSRPE